MRKALIVGAGKIGRGFIGQLLHRSGYELYFVDGSAALVEQLRKEGRYRVDIAGNDDAREYIPVRGAFTLAQPAAVADIMADMDIIACAVGAANLISAARFMREVLRGRDLQRPLDWLILENADQPAEIIRKALLENADAAFADFCINRLGLVETQVLRSGMLALPEVALVEPLALRMHDWWTLPADRDAFRAEIPAIVGLRPRGNFHHELKRKLFTFNGLNGPISYLGYAHGYRLMHEAACAPELQELLQTTHSESAHGLIHEFGCEREEHQQFQAIAWNKYRDPTLADAIERNARDSHRKLGPTERLIGPALLCLKHGRMPLAYASAIAAAISYTGSDDDGTQKVRAIFSRGGVDAVLVEVCQLPADSPLAEVVRSAFAQQRSCAEP